MKPLLSDETDRFQFALRNSGEPSFNNVYAELVQPLGYT
jgi:hypothetical protein